MSTLSRQHSHHISRTQPNGVQGLSPCCRSDQNLKGKHRMSFLAWIVLGLIAGFIGSKIVNKKGEGLILDIILGMVGAVVGGWLFTRFGAASVSGVNLYNSFVAV